MLTSHYEHAGYSRAYYLPNGDLVLCGPVSLDPNSSDPQAARFDAVLWVFRQPFDGLPVALHEPAWEGVAVDTARFRIAWARSEVDFNSPDLAKQLAEDRPELWVGDIVYEDETPSLVNKVRVLQRDQIPPFVVFEPEDFRRLPNRDEVLLTAYASGDAELLAVDLETGEIRNYSECPSWYDEAHGTLSDGKSTLVLREFRVQPFPHGLDLWRMTLDGSRVLERLTHFNHYRGYGVSNSDVSPDGRYVIFQVVDADEPPGNGMGILLFDFWGR